MSSSSLEYNPCAFCEEGTCAPYCSFRSVLTASPVNSEKSQKLLRCFTKTRLVSLFTRAGESEVEVEKVLQGLLNEIHERDIYPVTKIQRKIKDTQYLVDIANDKIAKAEQDLIFHLEDAGYEKGTLDKTGMNFLNTGFDHAMTTVKIALLKEELLKRGYGEELLAEIVPEENQGEVVTLADMKRILHRRAKKPKLT